MSDALANMYDDAVYDDLLKDAATDSRVGNHKLLVTDVVDDTWPNSGDPRRKIKGVLTTARNAKTDLTISPPPSPEVVAAEKASWEPGKLRAIANTVSMYRQLAQHYGKRPEDIAVGDEYEVKTGKSKVDKRDNSGGFIRVVAFLAPGTVGGQSNSQTGGSGPGF